MASGAMAGEAEKLTAQGAEAYGKGDFDATVSLCTEAIRLKPDYAEAYYSRGLAYGKKGDFNKTIADLTDAIRLKPDLAAAYHARGNAYDDKGDHDKAIGDYAEAIRLKPNDGTAYYNRGLAHRRNGDLDKAIADYTEAIRLKPGSPLAYHNRGIAYRKKGDLDKAVADYTEAIRLDPKSARAYLSRAIAYEEKGDVAKAADDFARMRQWEVPKSRIIAPISAPVVYEGLMLVLSNEKGAATIAFTTEIEYGVKYRYRYLPKRGKEESGEGAVFEKFKTISSNEPNEVRVPNNDGKLTLKAGPLHVAWSFAEAGKGYIYYHPEYVRVQIASASDFEKIDLSRFTAGGAPGDGENKGNILVFPPGGR
jgi:tetratricopeptide (TPR) repeat protein